MRMDARLVVGTLGGPRSNIWRLASWRDDVYLAVGAVPVKFSFHASGRCRKAFTAEHGPPPSLTDRATIKWWRAPTPRPDGSGRASCVLQVGIPTDTLSTSFQPLPKPATWINPAPAGMGTVIEMLFSWEAENDLSAAAAAGNRTVICYTNLPGGQTFAVTSRHATWEHEDFYMPASHHEGEDWLFTKDDPGATGRPVRITIFNNPKDGDSIIGWEFGGYRAPSAERGNLGVFRRDTVLETSRA